MRFQVRTKTKFRVSFRVKTRGKASAWVRDLFLVMFKVKDIDIHMDMARFGYNYG